MTKRRRQISCLTKPLAEYRYKAAAGLRRHRFSVYAARINSPRRRHSSDGIIRSRYAFTFLIA